MKKYTTKQSLSKKRILSPAPVAGAIVLIALIGGGIYARSRQNTTPAQMSKPTSAQQTGQDTINYDPASREDNRQNDANKEKIVEEQKQQDNSDPGITTLKSVTVTITSADIYSVFANVTGVVEDGGTCTAVFSNGTQTLSTTSTSVANVSYTQCGRMATPKLTGQGWTATVSYKSNSAQGVSKQIKVE
ncbi:hypothetical protein KC968_02600 [Candidatus Saccharibacteria bacterium]|nr:hypothetical protein [Candidatus Saccharibacteria bacterium]